MSASNNSTNGQWVPLNEDGSYAFDAPAPNGIDGSVSFGASASIADVIIFEHDDGFHVRASTPSGYARILAELTRLGYEVQTQLEEIQEGGMLGLHVVDMWFVPTRSNNAALRWITGNLKRVVPNTNLYEAVPTEDGSPSFKRFYTHPAALGESTGVLEILDYPDHDIAWVMGHSAAVHHAFKWSARNGLSSTLGPGFHGKLTGVFSLRPQEIGYFTSSMEYLGFEVSYNQFLLGYVEED